MIPYDHLQHTRAQARPPAACSAQFKGVPCLLKASAKLGFLPVMRGCRMSAYRRGCMHAFGYATRNKRVSGQVNKDVTVYAQGIGDCLHSRCHTFPPDFKVKTPTYFFVTFLVSLGPH